MAGGLLQLVSEGIQNQYLTKMPEITFFKTVYRRYTNFGLETSSLTFDQELDFGKTVSMTIPSIGDLISRNWLYVKFPVFQPDLNKISNVDVITNYQNRIEILTNQISVLETQYQYIIEYGRLMFGGFQIIEKYRNSININVNLLEVLFSNYYNSINQDYLDVINFIDAEIIDKTNIVSYLLDVGNSKTITEIIETSDLYQDNLIREMKIVLNRKKDLENKLENLQNKPIDYHWIPNLGHYLFTKIQIEMDGQIIDEITSEQMEIYYQHHLTEDYKENYSKLINGKSYQSFELFIPLNFWFNQSFGLGLPLVALRYSPIKLIFNINNIENLINFLDFENEFNYLRKNTYDYETMDVDLSGDSLIFEGKSYYLTQMEYLYHTNQVSLTNNLIYQENLEYHFDYLSESDYTYILETYGSIKENDEVYSLNQLELEDFILTYLTDNNLKNKILEWKYYINRFDQLTSYHLDNGELFADYIFMDEIEREKFANSQLNYIINLNQVTSFTIDQEYFNDELEFENHVKDVFWTFQKKNDLTGNRLNAPKYLTFLEEDYIINFQMILNGYRTFHDKNQPSYFRLVQNHKHLNSNFNKNIYYYSFSLYPEELQPSGGCSFGEIKGKEFQINFKDNTISENGNLIFKIHGRKQLILTISKGKGKLAFFNKT
jgi:hypothetical protein